MKSIKYTLLQILRYLGLSVHPETGDLIKKKIDLNPVAEP